MQEFRALRLQARLSNRNSTIKQIAATVANLLGRQFGIGRATTSYTLPQQTLPQIATAISESNYNNNKITVKAH